jgi:4a-hydroxytetrahydrobiopterin dehydratase
MNEIMILSQKEINEFVANNSPWVFSEDSLQASFEFADFEDAMRVVNLVAGEAKKLDHHPFWSNEYNKLAFVLSTHDSGDKVTEKDILLAKEISRLITA